MSNEKAYWFVGASYGGTDDQTDRFLKEGIWENGYTDKLLDKVREMQPGERIAIKSAYTRKYGLSFDSGGQTVSVMGIKAIGTTPESAQVAHDGFGIISLVSPRSTLENRIMMAEEYLGRSRVFRLLKSCPYGQLIELYAASLVKDGLALTSTIRHLPVIRRFLREVCPDGDSDLGEN
ncbi:hypothetical protein ACTXK7_12245 [Vreelandella alkaliphila]|uniref:hypothetical protein n=1 Tax=Vreelandella alkaliphila TaxID=272774 RepID=UPI003FD8D96C